MNLIQKLAIGTVGATIALATSIAPAFAATAWNQNVSGGSWAKAKAIENKTVFVSSTNLNTFTVSGNVVLAGSGGNQQSGNQDGNKMVVKGSQASGVTFTKVNETTIVVY